MNAHTASMTTLGCQQFKKRKLSVKPLISLAIAFTVCKSCCTIKETVLTSVDFLLSRLEEGSSPSPMALRLIGGADPLALSELQ